jgi:hypothetical protein
MRYEVFNPHSELQESAESLSAARRRAMEVAVRTGVAIVHCLDRHPGPVAWELVGQIECEQCSGGFAWRHEGKTK